ncbi:hypothetical protein [Virgibacillus ndiopensis]|uniref:hypothetical protein n=1 Tax=Virgibacillus ndiopensis TaxID=2004408 RepID=UPI000C089CAC|nr:hypothetical protein [Virgibacillus ndiopensis]
MNFNYYVTGNTAKGLVNFLESNIEDIKKKLVLKHPSQKYKTKIINKLIKSYETSKDIEILCSPLGNNYLDGIILRNKSVAVMFDSISTDINDVIEVDFEHTMKNSFHESQIQKFSQESYTNFATGLKIHDDLEAIYINEMDFNRADQLAEEFIERLLHSYKKQDSPGKLRHRLFGTNTADGVVNVIPQILDTLSTNYFIKGRAGTGKSTFMKKIANACIDHGLDVELYHCSFDPNSIDMVLVRELDVCIFDSTDPHEFFPKRNGDEIVDLYRELVTPGTDEKYEKEITDLNNQYKSYMKKGIECLKSAGVYLDKIEQKYMNDITEDEIEKAVADIINLIE